MDWPSSAIFWHCYPLGFVNAENRVVLEVQHRFYLITNWFDYLIELGCNGLLMAPIFASATHGYDTLDHFRIDPRLGDEGDFDDLKWKAKERGIRIVLDGVFNHLSEDHEIVRRAVAAGPDTDEGRWIRWVDGYPRGFEGNLDLVELDLTHPPVQDYVVEVMTYWLRKGIDGWRLDAAYSPGAEAWRPIVARVREQFPEVWVLGEVIHGDYAEFVTTSRVDSVTQYELWHAIWQSLNDHNFFSLEWTLGRHRTFCETFLPQTFVSNHDVTRIATKLDNSAHVMIAALLLLLIPGTPSIYAGDEQAFTGEKLDQPGGDEAVRPPFPMTPADLLPFGQHIYTQHQRLIALRRRHPWLVDGVVETQDVTNETITITVTKDDHRLVLRLNISDAEVDGVPADGYVLEVDDEEPVTSPTS